MKRKIVYISGGDAFDMNDVRAAFDEVRSTLNLDSDTILFGVPVDIENNNAVTDSVHTESVIQPVVDKVIMEKHDIAATPSHDEVKTETQDETVVPILSVLASKNSDDANDMVIDTPEPTDFADNMTSETETVELSNADTTDDISEMLDSEVPDDSHEKTLEELLETMEPLREDIVASENTAPASDETTTSESAPIDSAPIDDVDATLENLASEFVKNEDKMPTPKKTSERGKIGKLKNILPFKKMKKDDSGLMGDLFGWAGIAANDEDFSIPGFFTNAASKK